LPVTENREDAILNYERRLNKRGEVTRERRKLHNDELHNLCFSPYIIRAIKSRKMRLEGHVARLGKMRNAYKILIGKTEGKRPLGRHRRRWDNNIKMDHTELGCDNEN
jgi:hypothetical protein